MKRNAIHFLRFLKVLYPLFLHIFEAAGELLFSDELAAKIPFCVKMKGLKQ